MGIVILFMIVAIVAIAIPIPYRINQRSSHIQETSFYYSKPSRAKHRKKTNPSRLQSRQTTG